MDRLPAVLSASTDSVKLESSNFVMHADGVAELDLAGNPHPLINVLNSTFINLMSM